ncbi:cell wall hydrolase [Novosphingobium gossypii]|uniref:cell wall hydrolase n=1 Tax=Novosphingobium gossypii TaxID=1604774 RepID=UPI003D2355E1
MPRFVAQPTSAGHLFSGRSGAIDARLQLPPDDEQAELARTFNAQVPLTPGRLIAAQPFFLRKPAQDFARATDCLAAAGYYEAGMGMADQRAVAQVILNRVRHAAFPATICGVVFQGSDRRTGCQFTFTCDGSLLRRTPSPAAWQQARRMAAAMLLGGVDPRVGLATHYHTDWVSPAWDRAMDKIAVVRTHLFYRWRGFQPFRMPQSGAEPDVALLAALSPAHALPGPTEADLQQSGAPALALPSSPARPAAAIPRDGTGGQVASQALAAAQVFLVTLPASGSPASFQALAERQCAGVNPCRLIGWTDPARTPRALPMPGSAVDTIAFIYERRNLTAIPRVRWDCALFAPDAADDCI